MFLVVIGTAEWTHARQPDGSNDTIATRQPADLNNDARLREVRRAWTRREKLAQSLVVRWTETETRPKGMPSPFQLRDPKLKRDIGDDVLVEPIKFQTEYTLTIAGQKMRLDTHRAPPDTDWGRRMVGQDQRSAFDGTTFRRVTLGTSSAQPNQAYVREGRDQTDIGLLAVKPIVWAFRVLDPELCTLGPNAFVVSEEKSLENDGRFLLLERTERQVRTILWLDRTKEFAVHRYVLERTGTLETILHMDIVHQLDNHVGWVPSRWHVVVPSFDGNIDRQKFESIVQKMEFNSTIGKELFAFPIPVNTIVVNGHGDDESYEFIRSDGTTRDVSRDELLFKSREELAR